MGDPVTPIETATSTVDTAIPMAVGGEKQDGTKSQPANKNGKKADSGSSSSFFTWFIVLALLGVWTSVAMVYFDVVDYQGVIGKLVAYDTDGDGDFDFEDAKTLLDEKPGDAASRGAKKESSPKKEVGLKLQEALKQQLAIIQERVEAKKLAKLALAEVRQLLAKEEDKKEPKLGRKEMPARLKERLTTRLKKEEEKIENEEMEKALPRLRKEKAKRPTEKRDEESKDAKKGKMKMKERGEKRRIQRRRLRDTERRHRRGARREGSSPLKMKGILAKRRNLSEEK